MQISADSIIADGKEEGGLHLESTAPPERKESKKDCVHLIFCTCSGHSGTLSVEHDLMAGEVKARVEGLLGIPAGSQRWLVELEELKVADGASVASLNLKSGARVTVIHSGFVPLQPLPNAFSLELKSVRFQLHSRYSSGFTSIYKICGHFAERWMSFEPWRKNDHDRYLYDLTADTVEVTQSHWMAGTNRHLETLKGENPLSALSRAWASDHRRIAHNEMRFWRHPDAEGSGDESAAPGRSDDDQQEFPDYGAVQGWFTVPTENCEEIELRVPLPDSREIVRLLLDDEGRPLRAALKGCKMGALHEDIEEYSVNLTEKSDMSRDTAGS
mmetsp:Transcript_53237/g.105795  ORF Transcript_53237/g.105795 Transcript_53237/m.105795 type:complete len:329 (-) Transcript_53237:271-1257(-)